MEPPTVDAVQCRNSVLLVARPGALENEDAIEAALQLAGFTVDRAEWLPETFSEPTIVVVHLLSTLDRPRCIDGYKRFLRDYWQGKTAAGYISLIVLDAPRDAVDSMVGYGTLVDCYIREPCAPKLVVAFANRLRTQPLPDRDAPPERIEAAWFYSGSASRDPTDTQFDG